jgi:serine/threonine protein kinase
MTHETIDTQAHIGQSVGDYRLLRLLGEGTFGTVYLAEHADDHSYAAVKLFHIPLTGRNALRAFLNEARTVRLHHPHIVPSSLSEKTEEQM